MYYVEQCTALALQTGEMTLVEFEEFWREIDRLLFNVYAAQEKIGDFSPLCVGTK